jgi:cytoskeletal protein CcmA (bactofilin family)
MKTAGVPSIISADVVMRGNINSSGEVQFDGSLEGDIKATSLIIGEKASVKGEVVCENVMVRGRVEGGIRAKQVSLAATAHIQGDILHSSLSVESGAHFEGNCRHSDDPLSEAAAKDFRKARPSTGAPAPRPLTTNDDDTAPKRAAANEAPSFLSSGRSPLR